MRIGCPVF